MARVSAQELADDPRPLPLREMLREARGTVSLAERLAQVDPSYSMGRLLCEISAKAVPPSLWQQMGEEMQARLLPELASPTG